MVRLYAATLADIRTQNLVVHGMMLAMQMLAALHKSLHLVYTRKFVISYYTLLITHMFVIRACFNTWCITCKLTNMGQLLYLVYYM